MSNGEEINEATLLAYLNKELGQEEMLEVDRWLIQSSANMQKLNDIRETWKMAGRLRAKPVSVNTDDAWQKVLDEIATMEETVIPIRTKINFRLIAVAASLLMLIGVASVFLLNKPSGSGELKLTAHDFEMVLERKFERKIVLEEVVDSSKEAGYIRQYLKVNFQLFSQEQQLEMSYLGYEVNNKDELYFYFFFKDVPDPTTIKIINKLLFSISDQQQNIVHYKYSGQTKSVTLISAKSEDRITFNEDEDK